MRAGRTGGWRKTEVLRGILRKEVPGIGIEDVLPDVIHENVPPQSRRHTKELAALKERNWRKWRARVARGNRATWFHKAEDMFMHQFKLGVERKLPSRSGTKNIVTTLKTVVSRT